MAEIIFNDEDSKEIADGEAMKPYCEEMGVPFACEEGVCGTCIISIDEGMENLSEFTQEEIDFLGEQDEERLACQCYIKHGKVKVSY